MELFCKPGFSKDIIVSGNIDNKFTCFICNGLLRTPLQSFCGHRYCKGCVQRLLEGKETEQCPSCKTEDSENEFSVLRIDKMFPDNAIKRDFHVVQVKCLNNGCNWTGTLKNYEEHENECEFQTTQCHLCGSQVAVKAKGFHDNNECPERQWACEYCRTPLPFKLLEDHLTSECLYAPVDCDHCDVKGIPRAQLADHYDTSCSRKLMLCPITRCNVGVPSEDLVRHKQESLVNHVDNINKSLVQVDNKLTNYRAASLQDNERIRLTVDEMGRKLEELQTAPRPPARAEDDSTRSNQGAVGGTPSLGDVPSGDYQRQLQVQDTKIATFESIAAVLNSEILKCLNKIEDQSRRIGDDANQLGVLNGKVQELENSNRSKDELIARLQTDMTRFTDTTYDGVFVWKIDGVARKRQDAVSGRVTSVYSPPFYSSRTGYKMCARLYFNGDGMGRGSHLSLYFVIMRGDYDALLRWPFRQKVTLMLLDQNRREHVIDAFRPDPSSSSFKQPVSEMNIASGCPLFCPLSTLDNVGNKAYIKNDVIFIKINVDTSDLV